MKKKEKIQTFNPLQLSIVISVSLFVLVGLYLLSMNTPNHSSALQMLPVMLQ